MKTVVKLTPIIILFALTMFSATIVESYIRNMGFRPKDTGLVTLMAVVGYLSGLGAGWIVYKLLPRMEQDRHQEG